VNPIQNLIELSNRTKSILNIVITNINGQVLHTTQTDEIEINIDCSTWRSGVYFIKVSDENSQEYQTKLIKF